jgi:hypothetical protein
MYWAKFSPNVSLSFLRNAFSSLAPLADMMDVLKTGYRGE